MERKFITFGNLPIGSQFIDPRWNELCVKTSYEGARDQYCAKGYEVSFSKHEVVVVV